jgi:hypothetical protein
MLWDKHGASPRINTDGKWRDILSSLEYLNEEHGELFSVYSSDEETEEKYEKILERFLAYLVFRHCTEALDLEDFRARLGFSLFCESLLSSLIFSEKAKTLHEIAHLASIISEEIEYSEDNTFALTY